MSTEQSDTEETARQLAETCEHGVLVLDGPTCTECENMIPAGWSFGPCPGCDAPDHKGPACCTDCSHSITPAGKRYVFVYTASGRRMTDLVDI